MPSHLKSLELHGYKTFANRTLFEFAETVTAVVGPNGSGKSNIADSIRWVLGEQTFSLLRAKKTEDMIFSGSESRARAGMASATVTFDNSDGWLPIDFSEVAITRRAYRDGLNEYLLNGQRVRLKDISELLSQSGLAERTYTIIGQGLVDAALSLKADERRRLFEEAAGIGLHRSRKEEALRRLDTTRRNLERVEDILAELKPRLSSLERQARRAMEYEQVRTDLQCLLREWYGYHWHAAQKELTDARRVAQAQEARLERARGRQVELEADLAAIQESISEQRSQLNAWHRELAELHTSYESAARQTAVANERQHSLESQLENTHIEAARLMEEGAFLQEQVENARQEAACLAAELNEARSQLDVAQVALAARQAERSRVESTLQAARQELSALNTRQGQVQARQTESRLQAGRLAEALKVATQALERAERERQSAEKAAQAASRTESRAEETQRLAEAAIRDHRGRLEAAETARRQSQEGCLRLEAEIATTQARLDVLDQAESALSGYAAATQLILQAARQQQVDGVRGPLNQFLEAPPELEKAIAAALGEYLDAIVLDGDPDVALDLLHTGSGRGLLLPLPDLHPAHRPRSDIASVGGIVDSGSPPVSHITDPNREVLGIASDLVSCAEDLRPALELLLGNVFVTRERASARRLLKGMEPGVRAVTLGGEIFHASGQVQGGGGAVQNLLERGRARKEASAALKDLRARSVQADGVLKSLEASLKDLQAESAHLEAQREIERQEAQKASRLAGQARLTLEAANRQMHWAQEQRQRQQDDLKRSQSEADSLEQELARLEDDLVQARLRQRQETAHLETLVLDEQEAQLALWTTRLAVADRALKDAKERTEERLAALNRSGHSLTTLNDRQAELTAALQTLQSNRLEYQKAEAQSGENIQHLNRLIEPAETELLATEARQAEARQAESIARQALSTADHHHAQARIHLARRQEALDSLRRRIEDDFGLVAFEYEEQVSGPTPLPLQGMVEQLPRVDQLAPDIEENIKRQRAQLRRMGAINPEAQAEYQEVRQRYEFLIEQVDDLHQAEADVRKVIAELDDLMEREFQRTFEAVAAEFRQAFTRLFGGGSARLLLTDPDDLTTSGIDIEARLPGRRAQGLALLSGGERSLTAAALVFSLLKVSPTPFCVLDEMDAMLDEANVGRFRDLLRELSERTQFLIITHNRNTVQAADVIYGITMGRDSASQVLSLKLDEVKMVVD
jgi:chromosome segregation protein